ncbi:MAG TPA: hypothetical protein VFQ40_06160 [Actinomycetota bacterium]|nr:hypothetical protein [Actinomycetota bacterium]
MSLLLLFRPRHGTPAPAEPPAPSTYGFDRRKPLKYQQVGRVARRRFKKR